MKKNEIKFNPPFIPTRHEGSWRINKGMGSEFAVEKKPNWLHRKVTTLLLGWIWKDN
jgi:hypothetical protein